MESGKKLDVPARILVVEDTIAVGQGVVVLLRELGYEVFGPVATCQEAVQAAEEHRPDLVLLDIVLKGEQDGIESADRIGTDLDIPVVYLTGNSEEQLIQRAVLTKPYGYLRKPASVHELRAAIEIALYRHSIDKELREREELHRDTISGISDTILLTAEDGNFTYVSPNTHLIFGYSQEEVRKLVNVTKLLGRDLYDPQTLEKYGEISNIERRITDTSGEEHTLLVTVKRISIKGGTVLYSCRDITDCMKEHGLARAQRDLGIALSGTSNVAEALDFCLDTALQVSGMDAAAIHLINDHLEMELAARRGVSAEFAPVASGSALKLDNSGSVSGDQASYAPDSPTACSREEMEQEGLLGVAVIPIRHEGKVVASLCVASRSHTEVPAQALTSLETIAAQVGSALARIRAEHACRAAEMGVILDAIGEMVLYQDRDGKVLWANRVTGDSVGQGPSRLEGRHCYEIWHNRDSRCPNCPVFRAFATGNRGAGEMELPDGRIWSIRGYPVMDESGNVIGVVEVCRDITDRKKTEQALKESERRYHALFEDSPVSLWEEDFSRIKRYVDQLRAQGIENLKEYFDSHPEVVIQAASMVRIRDVNEATVRMFKAESKQHVKNGLDAVLCPESSEAFVEQLIAVAEGKREFETESVNLTLDGEKRDIFLRWSVAPGFEASYGKVFVSLMDITDRKRAEDQVRSSLEEKEVLLREVHHRVKNNLAVMSSLLNLQARYVHEESHRHLFEDAQARIRSMAVAHELLYRAENLADLNIPEYLARLGDHLVVSTKSLRIPIHLRKDIEPVSFGLDTAIPLGFILTELVTNSIKHAFPQGEEGEIRISLRSLDDDEFELSVSDTGVGVPPDVDPNNPRSLGLSLVNTFVNQLGGTLEVRTDKGTETRVRFTDASQSDKGQPAPPILLG